MRYLPLAYRSLALVGALLFGAGCASDPVTLGPRAWAAHPAVLEIDPAPEIVAISDIHGGYGRMAALLAAHGLIAGVPPAPSKIEWSGGGAALVVVGDMIDKGSQSLDVLDSLMALQESAASQGGVVVVLLGNHEAELFADPTNAKAEEFNDELEARNISAEQIADGSDPRIRWLSERPFAARIGGWFFAHAGDTGGRSIAELEAALERAVDEEGYGSDEIIGSGSILESQDWYKDDDEIGARYAAAVSAGHIVFGHDPHALGPDGEISKGQGGALFRIDTGMSPAVDYSEGEALRVRRAGGQDIAEALIADGTIRSLWSGAPSP